MRVETTRGSGVPRSHGTGRRLTLGAHCHRAWNPSRLRAAHDQAWSLVAFCKSLLGKMPNRRHVPRGPLGQAPPANAISTFLRSTKRCVDFGRQAKARWLAGSRTRLAGDVSPVIKMMGTVRRELFSRNLSAIPTPSSRGNTISEM